MINSDVKILDIKTWARVEAGVSFYFFDNGKGINKTARQTIIEKAYGKIGLNQTNILRSVLKGEFRSKTGKANRGKGLPQVNDFLCNDNIIISTVLTNKVIYLNKKGNMSEIDKLEYNFKGSLFTWIVELDDEKAKNE